MKRANELRSSQTVGLILICIGSLVIFPSNDAWYHDWLQGMLLIGFILFSYPFLAGWFWKQRDRKT